jgi:hypothetical protein
MPVFRQADDAAQGDVKLEAITQPLYDEQTIATGASTTSFFQNPGGRSRLFTNVETAGTLTWPKRYSIKAFRLVPSPATKAENLVSFYASGYFNFRVGEKDYFTAPLHLITPGCGLLVWNILGAAAALTPANGANVATNGEANHRNIYILQHAIWLPSVQNFRGIIEMAATFSTSASIDCWCYLEGELFREIQ